MRPGVSPPFLQTVISYLAQNGPCIQPLLFCTPAKHLVVASESGARTREASPSEGNGKTALPALA